MIHSKFFIPKGWICSTHCPQSVPQSEKHRAFCATRCFRMKSSGVRRHAQYWVPASRDERPKSEAEEGELCVLCLQSDVFFLSRDTGFLPVPSLIYPCHWAHRNRSMNYLNWHFKLSKLHNSDTPAEYSLPTLTTYSFIIPSKSPFYQLICPRRCNKRYLHREFCI